MESPSDQSMWINIDWRHVNINSSYVITLEKTISQRTHIKRESTSIDHDKLKMTNWERVTKHATYEVLC